MPPLLLRVAPSAQPPRLAPLTTVLTSNLVLSLLRLLLHQRSEEDGDEEEVGAAGAEGESQAPSPGGELFTNDRVALAALRSGVSSSPGGGGRVLPVVSTAGAAPAFSSAPPGATRSPLPLLGLELRVLCIFFSVSRGAPSSGLGS